MFVAVRRERLRRSCIEEVELIDSNYSNMIERKWHYIDRNGKLSHGIIAVSNTGEAMFYNGVIKPTRYRQITHINGKNVYLHTIIAAAFLVTVKKPEQSNIDHITHNPAGMNVNDVRNLRYCTQKENLNFEECKFNMSNAHKGHKAWNLGMRGTEYVSHYKAGKVINQYSKGRN